MMQSPRALALALLLTGCATTSTTPPADAAPEAQEPPTRTGVVHRNDTPYTLVGPALAVGDKAPTAALRNAQLARVTPDFADGRPRVVLIVPSLDTPTCGMQTRTFNGEASDMGDQVEVLVISRDLPFAQARFCGAHGIDRVVPLSDYESGAFGQSWGLFIQETALLARAVAVIDGTGTVTYLEVVPNLPDEPAYAPALAALAALVDTAE